MSDNILNDELLPTRFITLDRRITDRALRKQIARGAFPKPDANIDGRNYWKASTYTRWKNDALAGRFARAVRVGRSAGSVTV